LSLGVDIHEEPDLDPVVGGELVAIHANLEPFVHERQDGGASRVVEGHHVIHSIVLTIFHRLVPVVIEPMSRLRHQQAGYIPMVEMKPDTFIIDDPLAKIIVAYG
jgi:hypothetical protein